MTMPTVLKSKMLPVDDNALEKLFDPHPPVGIVWIRARMSDRNFIFCYMQVKLSYFLEIIGRTAQVLADLRLCCLHAKKFLAELGKKLSCIFKYTRTVNERLFRPFFFLF